MLYRVPDAGRLTVDVANGVNLVVNNGIRRKGIREADLPTPPMRQSFAVAVFPVYPELYCENVSAAELQCVLKVPGEVCPLRNPLRRIERALRALVVPCHQIICGGLLIFGASQGKYRRTPRRRLV